jgi:hypothetical protein
MQLGMQASDRQRSSFATADRFEWFELCPKDNVRRNSVNEHPHLHSLTIGWRGEVDVVGTGGVLDRNKNRITALPALDVVVFLEVESFLRKSVEIR